MGRGGQDEGAPLLQTTKREEEGLTGVTEKEKEEMEKVKIFFELNLQYLKYNLQSQKCSSVPLVTHFLILTNAVAFVLACSAAKEIKSLDLFLIISTR